MHSVRAGARRVESEREGHRPVAGQDVDRRPGERRGAIGGDEKIAPHAGSARDRGQEGPGRAGPTKRPAAMPITPHFSKKRCAAASCGCQRRKPGRSCMPCSSARPMKKLLTSPAIAPAAAKTSSGSSGNCRAPARPASAKSMTAPGMSTPMTKNDSRKATPHTTRKIQCGCWASQAVAPVMNSVIGCFSAPARRRCPATRRAGRSSRAAVATVSMPATGRNARRIPGFR